MARRFQEARKMNHLSMAEAGEKLGVSQPTISAWEAERKCPSVDAVERMADLYGVTTDFLLGRSSEATDVGTRPINNTLLLALNNQPVWSEKYGWLLVCGKERCLRDSTGMVIPFSDVTKLYISPSSFSSIIPPQTEPLTKGELRYHTELWVEPISEDTALRQKLRGWYRIIAGYAENQNGNRFALDTYEAKWIAFSHSPLEVE